MFLFILSINKIFIATSVFYFTCFLPRLFAPAHTRSPSINNWKQIYDVEFRYLCFFLLCFEKLETSTQTQDGNYFPIVFISVFIVISIIIIRHHKNISKLSVEFLFSGFIFSAILFNMVGTIFVTWKVLFVTITHIAKFGLLSPSFCRCYHRDT